MQEIPEICSVPPLSTGGDSECMGGESADAWFHCKICCDYHANGGLTLNTKQPYRCLSLNSVHRIIEHSIWERGGQIFSVIQYLMPNFQSTKCNAKYWNDCTSAWFLARALLLHGCEIMNKNKWQDSQPENFAKKLTELQKMRCIPTSSLIEWVCVWVCVCVCVCVCVWAHGCAWLCLSFSSCLTLRLWERFTRNSMNSCNAWVSTIHD